MDFIPILLAILYGTPFNGFSLVSGEQNEVPTLYHYSSLESGTKLSLQCLNNSGSFIDVETATVGSINYNVATPWLPVRRTDFLLPQSCTITTSTYSENIAPGRENACLVHTAHSKTRRQTFRIMQEGSEVNIWNNIEVVRFIQDGGLDGNLRNIANRADLGSENILKFQSTEWEYNARIISGISPREIGGDGGLCPSGHDPAAGGDTYDEIAADWAISFESNEFIENINFFDFTTYDYTLYGRDISGDKIESGVDTVLDRFYAEGAPGMVINPESYEVWGISGEYWDKIAKLIVKKYGPDGL